MRFLMFWAGVVASVLVDPATLTCRTIMVMPLVEALPVVRVVAVGNQGLVTCGTPGLERDYKLGARDNANVRWLGTARLPAAVPLVLALLVIREVVRPVITQWITGVHQVPVPVHNVVTVTGALRATKAAKVDVDVALSIDGDVNIVEILKWNTGTLSK